MVLPYTTFQSENPEDLWKWMAEWEKTTGGKILAIPHNGNLSNGRMFALTTFSGDPLSKAWADERQKWEPLFEVIQMKGQSEAHPSVSTTDEFVKNYELWDRGNLTMTPKKPDQLEHEYVARGAQERSEDRTGPRDEPVQVRHGRRHRHAQWPRGRGRGQLLREVPGLGTEAGPLGRGRDEDGRSGRQGLGDDGGRVTPRCGRRGTRAPNCGTP